MSACRIGSYLHVCWPSIEARVTDKPKVNLSTVPAAFRLLRASGANPGALPVSESSKLFKLNEK